MSNRALVIILTIYLITSANADVKKHGKDRGVHHKHIRIQKRDLTCRENEQLAKSGSDCLTCENYQNMTCPVMNVTSCYCLNGYVRNKDGRCISKANCATSCGVNERFTLTKPCEFQCGSSDLTIQVCQRNKTSGCVCNDGFTRCPGTNTCFPEKECYPVCNENERVHNWCDLQCNNGTLNYHCDMPFNFVKNCGRMCVCKQYYVRDMKTGKCVPYSNCVPEPIST